MNLPQENPTHAGLEQIEHSVQVQNEKIRQLEAAMNRPSYLAISSEKKSWDTDYTHEHSNAFKAYLRQGREEDLMQLEKKALSAGLDSDGGYLLTRPMQQLVDERLTHSSPLRQLASVETISTDSLDIIEDYDHAGAGWTTETASRLDSATPKLQKRTIQVHEMYAQPKATQRLIDDASIDIETWLEDKISSAFMTLEQQSFLNGDGKGKPRGILHYPAGHERRQIEHFKTATKGAFDAESLIKLQCALGPRFSKRGAFLLHPTTLQELRLLKHTASGQFLWSPSLVLGQPATLLGAPVYECEDMPIYASGNPVVVYADFKSAYQIVDRAGIRVLRDPFTEKPFVKFYATKRVGGDVKQCDAVKVLELS